MKPSFTPTFIFLMDEVPAHLLNGWQRRLARANQGRSSRARWLVEGLDLARKGVTPIMGEGSLFLRLPVLVRDRRQRRGGLSAES